MSDVMRMLPLLDDHRVFRARAVLALLPAGTFGGCLKIAPTDGVLLCGPAPNVCPSGYTCAADQHCWKVPPIGGTDMNGGAFALAISTTPEVDLAAPAGSDLAMTLSTDMAQPVNPVDMAQPKPIPDLAT